MRANLIPMLVSQLFWLQCMAVVFITCFDCNLITTLMQGASKALYSPVHVMITQRYKGIQLQFPHLFTLTLRSDRL